MANPLLHVYIVKRISPILFFSMLCCTCRAQVGMLIGAGGGGGATIVRDEFKSIGGPGTPNAGNHNLGWGASPYGEFLVALGRLRLGYRFVYSYSDVNMTGNNYMPATDPERNTIYFTSKTTEVFGNYFVLELSVLKKGKFSLVPGIMLGGYTGFKIDALNGYKAKLADDTNRRFSAGAELNAEFKVKRISFVLGPNYYFLKMADKEHSNWKEYRHNAGASFGIRVNIGKQASV